MSPVMAVPGVGRYQVPKWTTSSNWRRDGLWIGFKGRPRTAFNLGLLWIDRERERRSISWGEFDSFGPPGVHNRGAHETLTIEDICSGCGKWPHWINATNAKRWQEPECLVGREMVQSVRGCALGTAELGIHQQL